MIDFFLQMTGGLALTAIIAIPLFNKLLDITD
jgi:hypothetical protein